MSHATTYASIVNTTFNTPLVALRRLIPARHATVLLKLEFFNPFASVKDRIGRSMIEEAEASGVLNRETKIIEPTSGNTGIALAFVAAAKGYELTLTMPESMSVERRGMLRALGAKLVLTPASDGMKGAIAQARELADATPDSWIPQQFENPANPAIHEQTTGPEIWEDTQRRVDAIVAGVGTGGPPGPHKIQGIGAGFIPKNLDTSLLNGVETVTNEEAFEWAHRLAAVEGILGGISTGANVAAAARVAARPEYHGKTIVTIACSFGERYLSTPLYEDLTAL